MVLKATTTNIWHIDSETQELTVYNGTTQGENEAQAQVIG